MYCENPEVDLEDKRTKAVAETGEGINYLAMKLSIEGPGAVAAYSPWCQ